MPAALDLFCLRFGLFLIVLAFPAQFAFSQGESVNPGPNAEASPSVDGQRETPDTPANPQLIYKPPRFLEPPPPKLPGNSVAPIDWLDSFRVLVLEATSYAEIAPYISLSDRHKFEYLTESKDTKALAYYRGLLKSIVRYDGAEIQQDEARVLVICKKQVRTSQGAYRPPPYMAATIILTKSEGNWRLQEFQFGARLSQMPVPPNRSN